MRTVKKSDIIFDLNPRRVYIENFTCRFYTVNEADYSIGYSSEDVVTTIDGENVKYSLNLDWKQLRNVGRGMLVFKCLNNIPDTHFPDGEFNSEYVEQTDYFIDTFEVEPEEEESFNERIEAVESGLTVETETRATDDAYISGAVDTLDAKVEGYKTATDTAIANEESARTEADNAISAATDAAIASEASARTAADDALSTAINNEASARTEADNAISAATDAAIASEASARTAADDALSTAINNETSARTAADNAISAVVDTKASIAYVEDVERTIARSLTDLNDVLGDVEDVVDTKADVSAFTAHTASTVHMDVTEKTNLDSLATNIATISGITSGDVAQWNKEFDDAKYEMSGTTHVINFYHDNVIKATIVADDFIKDGMVSSVEVTGGNLVISFNTDAGQEPISIPLTDIFDPANYYTKTDTDTLLSAKAAVIETDGTNKPLDKVTLRLRNRAGGTIISNTQINLGEGLVYGSEGTTTLSVSGKQDTLVSGTNIKTINNESLLGSGNLNVVTDLSNYYTKTEVDAAVSGKANSSDVYTTGQTYTKTEVDAAISGKADSSAVTEEISAAVSGKADTSAVTEAITAAVSGKQDTLVSGTNIKTINNESLLGSGNLNVVTDLSNYYTKSETDAALSGKVSVDYVEDVERVIARSLTDLADSVDDMETSISGKADSSAVTSEISAAVSGKQDTLVSGTNIKTINNESILGSGNITIQGGGSGTIDPTLDSGSTNAVANSAITAAINAVSGAVSGKQDTLVSGTNIKTINGSSVLGSGDLTVSNTVSLTQAQYNALTTIDPNTLYIISDATEIDITDYYTKSETDAIVSGKADSSAVTEEISAAVSGKQDTLVSGTNIKTINNESILGSGNITIQGGGATYSAGTNISIDTGNTISCTLPIVMKSSNMRINSNSEFGNSLVNCFTFGNFNTVGGSSSCSYLVTFGSDNDMSEANDNRRYRFAFGHYLKTQNQGEIAFSQYNKSVSISETFGDSGNTLFSVGNGTSNNARHNAFEIRQNGDIYITSGGTDIKLQDNLGGGSITIDPTLDSGSTNAVANSAITSAFDTVNTTLSGKANSADVYTTGNTYSKTEVDSALSGKANSSDVYTTGNTYSKTEVDTALSGKADTSTTYTKSEVYNKTEIDSMIGTIETALSNI